MVFNVVETNLFVESNMQLFYIEFFDVLLLDQAESKSFIYDHRQNFWSFREVTDLS